MNSQRLLTISTSLADELKAANLLRLMNTLSSQLTDAINGPSESTQRAVQSTREDLATKLREATSNSMSPGMRVDLGALTINERTPVSELIGNGLLVSCLSSSMQNSSPFKTAETPLIPHQGADRIVLSVSGTAH